MDTGIDWAYGDQAGRTVRPEAQSKFLLSKEPPNCPQNQGSHNSWATSFGDEARPATQPQPPSEGLSLPLCVAMDQNALRLFQETSQNQE